MFIYNLYKPLNVALGSNDDQTVFLHDSLLGICLFCLHFCVTFLIDNTVLPVTYAAVAVVLCTSTNALV